MKMIKLSDKNMDAIGKVLLVIFCFLMLMFSIEAKAQTFTVTKDELHNHYVIDFIDEYNDSYYVNGDKFVIKGKLDLTQKEYKQLIKEQSLKLKSLLIAIFFIKRYYLYISNKLWILIFLQITTLKIKRIIINKIKK